MKTKKIFKTILNISSYVLIFFLFSMLAFVIISNFSGKIAFIGGRSLMWVKTGSMDPTIEERSYIVVKRSDGSDIEIGDVITFKSPDPLLKGAYNTHRVVRIDANGNFITRGDANLKEDDYAISKDRVVAKYVRNLPVLTIFGRFLSEPIGIVTIIMIMVFTCMLVYFPDAKKVLEEMKQEKIKEREALIEAKIQEEVKRLSEENKKG